MRNFWWIFLCPGFHRRIQTCIHQWRKLHQTQRSYSRQFYENSMLSCPGEWWNENVEDVLEYALARGGGYNISDAITINGQPGFLYNFSSKGEICSGYKNWTQGRKGISSSDSLSTTQLKIKLIMFSGVQMLSKWASGKVKRIFFGL